MKKFRLIPYSRLTIIFILAVTIPGGILTYLSIQNITNLKELTEKKILEEEKEISDLLIKNFDNVLKGIAADFNNNISQWDESDLSAMRFSDSIAFIEHSFVLDQNAKFLWPRVSQENIIEYKAASTNNFDKTFIKAEQEEFIWKNYAKASAIYQRALRIAYTRADSAQCLNAIARVNVKNHHNKQALSYYFSLISKFYSVIDQNGLLYINYALTQALKLSDTTNTYLILDTVNFVLLKMESGEIPLNSNTEVLLDLISEWIPENSNFNPEDIDKAKESINYLKNQIAFINDNNEYISRFVNNSERIEKILLDENYYVISDASAEQQKLIVLKFQNNFNYYLGFSVDLKELTEYSLKITIPSSFRYDYQIELLNNDSIANNTGKGLFVISTLNPFVSNESLVISLQNENMVTKNMARTSWIYAVSILLLLGGMILGIFLIIRDINREKQLSELRSDFVSNVTHDLKTPLTSIYMFAESILLGHVKTKTEQKEYLSIILKETERLKRLINNILDFSKREKGKVDYYFSSINLSELVKSSINNLEYWMIAENFIIKTEIEEGIFGYVDSDALKQAVINLLSNSIKYSYNRKEIYVGLSKNENSIYIEVGDKGVGIPEDQIDKIFNKFYRVENNSEKENSGTGLGLTVVKEIVKAHNGKILVESSIDQGSTFTIVLNS